jgi:hypothetical protein
MHDAQYNSRTARQVRRKPFTPPRERPARGPRRTIDWPPAGWWEQIPPALLRALAAILFVSAPTLEDRFGTLVLPVVCVGLAVVFGLAADAIRRWEMRSGWPIVATDVLTLLALTPVVIVASGIEVADIQLGGRPENFAAAAIAVVGVTAVCAIAAAILSAGDIARSSLALLPAALIVAAVIVGAERFSATNVAQGLSAAWMVAAVTVMASGLLPRRVRPLVPVVAFAGFAVMVTVMGRNVAGRDISSTNAAIALVTTGIAGAILLAVPALSEHIKRDVERYRPAGESGPVGVRRGLD